MTFMVITQWRNHSYHQILKSTFMNQVAFTFWRRNAFFKFFFMSSLLNIILIFTRLEKWKPYTILIRWLRNWRTERKAWKQPVAISDPNQLEFALTPYIFLAYAGSNFRCFSHTVFLMILFTFEIKYIPLAKYEKVCPVVPFLLFLHGTKLWEHKHIDLIDWALII